MEILIAVVFMALSLMGWLILGESAAWMIVSFLLALVSILAGLILRKKLPRPALIGIEAVLLLLSVGGMALAGTVEGGYRDFYKMLDKMADAYEKGDTEAAEKLLAKYLDETDGNDVKDEIKISSTEDFIREVQRGKLVSAQKDALFLAKAKALYKKGNDKDMKTVLDSLSDSRTPDAYYLRGAYLTLIYADQEDADGTMASEMAKLYGEAAERYPNEYAFQYRAGMADLSLADYSLAKYHLNHALLLTDDPAQVLIGMAAAYCGTEEYWIAEGYLDEAREYSADASSEELAEGIAVVQEWLDAASSGTADAEAQEGGAQ